MPHSRASPRSFSVVAHPALNSLMIIPGQTIVLPTTSDYAELSRLEGAVFIEKFEWLATLYGDLSHVYRSGRMPIIRRGRGFGKTTFLSMLSSQLSNWYFSRTPIVPTRRTELSTVPPRMLTLWLDFAELEERITPSSDSQDVLEATKSFLASSLRTFYTKYTRVLGDPPEGENGYNYGYYGMKVLNASLMKDRVLTQYHRRALKIKGTDCSSRSTTTPRRLSKPGQ